MASNVSYTVYGNFPRLLVRDTDKSSITARTNSATSWQTLWDGDFTDYANALLGLSDSNICTTSENSIHNKFLVLALYGWIDGGTSYHNKLLSVAKYLAQTTSIHRSWTGRRYQILALAYAYNFLRTGIITFSEADRKIIGDVLVSWFTASPSDNEFLHGHSAANCMAQFAGAVTLHGESGSGYDYSAACVTAMDEALGFWFGDTPGDDSRMEVFRYFCADGGHWMGSWYSHIGLWAAVMLLQSMHTGLVRNADTPSALQVESADYNPLEETWLATIGEYPLNAWFRGDYDYWQIYDTARVTNPWEQDFTRIALSFLITNGGDYRKPLRWLQDTLTTYTDSLSQLVAYSQAHDLLLYDPADSGNASVHPKDASPSIPKTTLMNPPGSFWHRNTWEYPEACIINVECPERYFAGHTHLNAGAMQIAVRDDMVLLNSGIYRTTGGAEDYGYEHHRQWYQQSLGHSGVPLCNDGVTSHRTDMYVAGSWQTVTISAALGGQLYKELSGDRDPANLSELRFDGGGEAWKRADAELVSDSDAYAFLYMDLRKAYLKEYTDIDTDTERLRKCQVKMLVIKGEGTWPVILRVVHMEARLGTMFKRDHFHAWNNWALSNPHQDVSGAGDTLRATALGYKQTGKILVDLYNWEDFTAQVVGGGVPDAAGYGALQFYYSAHNYKPSYAAPSRFLPDLGKYRIEFIANAERTEEYFVELLQPMGVNDAALNYTWIDEANWYGVRFSESSHEYRIHKTQKLASTSGDSVAPAAPTGVAASQGDSQVTVTWTPNTETDMAQYKVYYREKV